MSDNPIKETYIGDGVYASYDGYHIVLRTRRDGDRDDMIYLGPAEMEALWKYVKTIYPKEE